MKALLILAYVLCRGCPVAVKRLVPANSLGKSFLEHASLFDAPVSRHQSLDDGLGPQKTSSDASLIGAHHNITIPTTQRQKQTSKKADVNSSPSTCSSSRCGGSHEGSTCPESIGLSLGGGNSQTVFTTGEDYTRVGSSSSLDGRPILLREKMQNLALGFLGGFCGLFLRLSRRNSKIRTHVSLKYMLVCKSSYGRNVCFCVKNSLASKL